MINLESSGVEASDWRPRHTQGVTNTFFFVTPGSISTTTGFKTSFFFVKPGTARYFGMRMPQSASLYSWVTFDSQTLATSNSAGVNLSGIDQLANGWLRLWANHSISATSTDVPILFLMNGMTPPATNQTVPTAYTGTGLTFYFWGGQLGPADTATSLPVSYMPTTGTAVSRGADAATIQRTGLGTLALIYSDNSAESIYPSTSVDYAIPTNLSRPIIKRITGYATQAALRQAVSTTPHASILAGFAQSMTRQVLTTRVRMDTVQITVPLCYGTGETIVSGTTTSQAYLEYNGATYPITFGGIATGSATGVKFLDSDEVALPVSIPAGSPIEIREYRTNSSSQIACFGDWAQPSGGGFAFGASITNTASTGGGAVTDTTPGTGGGVSVVACRHNSRAGYCGGDSVDYGQGAAGNSHYAPISGLFVPALQALMPTINGGSQGDTVQNFVASSGANSSARRHYASFCTTGVCNFGINDLNTRTAVQINADADTYDVMLGIPNIWSTITPSATSTDNFATATGQIPAGFTVARGTVNDYRRTKAKFFEVADALEDGRNVNIWRSVGDGSVTSACTSSNSPWTNVHPTSYGYGLANAAVNPAYIT